MFAVLEVGGTHVTSALVDLENRRVTHSARVELDSSGSAEEILDTFEAAVRHLGTGASHQTLVVAIPGPFDYENGIGDFEGVGKFASLRGVRIGDLLAQRLGNRDSRWLSSPREERAGRVETSGVAETPDVAETPTPRWLSSPREERAGRVETTPDPRVLFLNDVTAYALGQYELLDRPRRLVTMTLGTGAGSCFLADGTPVTDSPTVPPHGWIYLLEHNGKPLEETFSRRAIVGEFERICGQHADVDEIANLARGGDESARGILDAAFTGLADAVAPWLLSFETETLVIGGTVANSWDLVERWFEPEVTRHFEAASTPAPQIRPGSNGESAALIGAARFAADQSP